SQRLRQPVEMRGVVEDIDDLLVEQIDAFGGRSVSAEDLAFDTVLVVLEAVQDGEVRIDGGVEQSVDECFGAQGEQFAVGSPVALLVREVGDDVLDALRNRGGVDEASDQAE